MFITNQTHSKKTKLCKHFKRARLLTRKTGRLQSPSACCWTFSLTFEDSNGESLEKIVPSARAPVASLRLNTYENLLALSSGAGHVTGFQLSHWLMQEVPTGSHLLAWCCQNAAMTTELEKILENAAFSYLTRAPPHEGSYLNYPHVNLTTFICIQCVFVCNVCFYLDF